MYLQRMQANEMSSPWVGVFGAPVQKGQIRTSSCGTNGMKKNENPSLTLLAKKPQTANT